MAEPSVAAGVCRQVEVSATGELSSPGPATEGETESETERGHEVDKLASPSGVTVTVATATVAVLTTVLTVVSKVTVGRTVSTGTTVTKTVVTSAAHVVFPLLGPRLVSEPLESQGPEALRGMLHRCEVHVPQW